MPLGQILDHLDQLPSSGWLYIEKGAAEITSELRCYPADIDSREVNDEEMAEFETAVAAAGFTSFLCDDQLQDIIANLELQQPRFSRNDLVRAIDFYWRHDAFILLGGGGK